jgi:hypothetical protein
MVKSEMMREKIKDDISNFYSVVVREKKRKN